MTDSSQENPGGRKAASQSPSEALRDLLESHGDGELRCVELCPICRAADVLRATAPDDLKDQWQVVQREALLTMKAAIDRYVERLDAEPPKRGPSVQDSPIE
jgi:hypothetical protein